MIEFESRFARLMAGGSERMHGVKRNEGSFEELAESYLELVSKARRSVHTTFSFLPPEFFMNQELLAKIRSLKEQNGEVEVVTKQTSQGQSLEVLDALAETGATIYLNQGYIKHQPFTILDGKDLVVHHSNLRLTDVEQIYVPDTIYISKYITDFNELKRNSLTLE